MGCSVVDNLEQAVNLKRIYGAGLLVVRMMDANHAYGPPRLNGGAPG